MDAQAVLKDLEAKGKPNTAAIYRKHGVKGPCFGVSYADIGKMTKELDSDQKLSRELWDSGVHDARVLATQVADAEQMSERELDRWLADVNDYVLGDAVSSLAARSPVAISVATKWIKGPHEWRAAAGWNIVAILAVGKKLSVVQAAPLLERIETEIHQAKNRARYSMNNALIAIGGAIAELRDAALLVAKRIGQVEVDHGQTGCVTPDAASYIQRMAARASGRTQVNRPGKKTKGSKSRAKERPVSKTSAIDEQAVVGKESVTTASPKASSKKATKKKPVERPVKGGKKKLAKKPTTERPTKKAPSKKTAKKVPTKATVAKKGPPRSASKAVAKRVSQPTAKAVAKKAAKKRAKKSASSKAGKWPDQTEGD